MPKVYEDRIVWDADDWMSGFAPQFSASSNKYIGKGAQFMREMDPYRAMGYVSPGYNPINLLQMAQIDALQLNGTVYVSGSKSSAFSCGGTKVHCVNLTDNSIASDGIWPKAIAGSTMSDITTYRIGGATSSPYILVSYYDGTDLEVARYDVDMADQLDAWQVTYWSGALAINSTDRNVPHPFIQGYNGVVYIGDGNDLASIDGSGAGTGTASAFSIPYEYIITSGVATEKYIVLFAYKATSQSGSTYYRGDAKAFFWDYISSGRTYMYDLEDNYVNCGFIWNGKIGCFTYGRGKGADGSLSALKIFNGIGFETVGVFNDNIPRHGGWDVIDGMLHANADGKIYTYGSPYPGLPAVFNHRTSGSGTVTGGMLKNLSGAILYASSASTNLQRLNTQFNSNTSWQSLYVSPLIGPDEIAQALKVVVEYAGTVSGGLESSVLLGTDLGANANTTVLSVVNTVTVQTTAETSTSKQLITTAEVDSAGNALPFFSSINLAFTYAAGSGSTAAPQYKKVTVYYRRIKREL